MIGGTIARQQWRSVWRDRRLPMMSLVTLVLVLLVLPLSIAQWQQQEGLRAEAADKDHQTFNSIGSRNPHSIAHFSRFATRPMEAENILDMGTRPYAGSAVWMQAHHQDLPELRAAEDRVDFGRSAELSLAWIVQLLLPLLIVVLGFDAVSDERERGTLAMLRGWNVSMRALMRGKLRAFAGWIAGMMLAIAFIHLVCWLLMGGGMTGRLLAAMLLWYVVHGLYLLLWAAWTVIASAWFREPRSAMLLLLSLWVVMALIVPRAASSLADRMAPPPDAQAFAKVIKQDIKQGMDGHNPADARSQALKKKTMQQYNVNSIEDLPVSFEAIALQESERYGNQVFDKHHGALADTYRAQAWWRRLSGVVSPTSALTELSMGLAYTSLARQLDFTRAAEDQRREIIEVLNKDMEVHGAGQGFDYKADPTLWANVPGYRHSSASLGRVLVEHVPDLLILLLWGIFTTFMFLRVANLRENSQ